MGMAAKPESGRLRVFVSYSRKDALDFADQLVPALETCGAQALDEVARTKLKIDQTTGAVVTRLFKGLPAEAAGLAVNDVILAVDGQPMTETNTNTINKMLDAVPAGGSIRLTILRAGERKEIELRPRF